MMFTCKYNKLLGSISCAVIMAAALSTAACTPTTATRGNFLEEHQLVEVKPGVHTRSEVMRILGSPTTIAPFDPDTWYYLGQHTEKHGIFDPEIIDERVIVVTFNSEGTVESVRERQDGRMEVPISERATPTHGNDISLMQQFLGNLGRFNPEQEVPR
jgi:outer membrane protein assembly factor BamE (lipoprotein component of BamABCDE complex)